MKPQLSLPSGVVSFEGNRYFHNGAIFAELDERYMRFSYTYYFNGSIHATDLFLKFKIAEHLKVKPSQLTYNFLEFHPTSGKVLFFWLYSEEAAEFGKLLIGKRKGSQIYKFNDHALIEIIKDRILQTAGLFLEIVKFYNPANTLEIDSFDDEKILVRLNDGNYLTYESFFTWPPSLQKTSWKKLTPQNREKFKQIEPAFCRICQNPTELMCALAKVPFCSVECQKKYYK
jgi:hypothetical protein